MTLLIDAIAIAIDIDIANIDISMIFLSPAIDYILRHAAISSITLLRYCFRHIIITPLRHYAIRYAIITPCHFHFFDVFHFHDYFIDASFFLSPFSLRPFDYFHFHYDYLLTAFRHFTMSAHFQIAFFFHDAFFARHRLFLLLFIFSSLRYFISSLRRYAAMPPFSLFSRHFATPLRHYCHYAGDY
jgi:hypothetical protein